MLRVGSSPGNRLRTAVPVGLLPAAVIAAAAAVAAAAPQDARAAVLWCGLAGTAATLLAGLAAVRRGRALAELREQWAAREQELQRHLERQRAEMYELARTTVPEAIGRMQRGEYHGDVLRTYLAQPPVLGPEFNKARIAVLRSVLFAVDEESAKRESTQRAVVSIARRVQAIVHRQAVDLRRMEHRHGTVAAVLADMLTLDHENALIGRLADSISVLGGARPGRQWNRPVALYRVLRGGMSRVLDYRRIELHPVSDVAVQGPAVEPLIHALAELLDNATRYSPPQTMVHLTASEVQSGIAIEIEDGGLSLGEEGRAKAERMLAEAAAGMDLGDLGETPRLGLAVVGRLCKAYGFQVALRSSAYGGVRAVLIVPAEYLTTAPNAERTFGIGGMAPGPLPEKDDPSIPPTLVRNWKPKSVLGATRRAASGPVRTVAPAPEYQDDFPVVTERTPSGLPQRRRHTPGVRLAAPVGPSAEQPAQPGMWLAAFTEGVTGQRQPAGPDGDHTSEEPAGRGEK